MEETWEVAGLSGESDNKLLHMEPTQSCIDTEIYFSELTWPFIPRLGDRQIEKLLTFWVADNHIIYWGLSSCLTLTSGYGQPNILSAFLPVWSLLWQNVGIF